MVVAPSIIGVLGIKWFEARCQNVIGGLLRDEGDEMDHPRY